MHVYQVTKRTSTLSFPFFKSFLFAVLFFTKSQEIGNVSWRWWWMTMFEEASFIIIMFLKLHLTVVQMRIRNIQSIKWIICLPLIAFFWTLVSSRQIRKCWVIITVVKPVSVKCHLHTDKIFFDNRAIFVVKLPEIAQFYTASTKQSQLW